MSAISPCLEMLQSDVAWFARARELRLHVVQADSGLHEAVSRIALKGARLSDVPAPYVMFPTPFAGADAGWSARQATLDDAYSALSGALEERGKPVQAPAAEVSTGVSAAFGSRVLYWMHATASHVPGPVLVFVPNVIEDSDRFSTELLALVNWPPVSDARWMVVVPEAFPLQSLTGALGNKVLVTNCQVSPAAVALDLDIMVANSIRAGSEATGYARAGMAWPRQPPPPPKILPRQSQEELAREKVRLCLMQSASLMQKQQNTEAIAPLAEAQRACAEAGLVDERLAVRLVLASTLASVGHAPRAMSEFDSLKLEATSLDRPTFALQAAHAKAALQMGTGDTHGAISTYGDAIGLARAIGDEARPLLIELLRVLGQLGAANGADKMALECWGEALTVAGAAPPGADLGSAPEVAKAMAAMFRRKGQLVQAASLEQQAAELEARPLAAAKEQAALEAAEKSAEQTGGGP